MLFRSLWLQPQRQVVLQRDRKALEELWDSYLHGKGPLQYLVGRSPWRDLVLDVGPGVLIPRQETEMLVELVFQAHRRESIAGGVDALSPRPAPSLWADLGTGSGCLAIALAQAFPKSRGWAVDLCAAALAQASRNLEAQGIGERVSLLAGSWWDPLQPWWGRLELVVANPPYIPSDLVTALEPVVRDHEPTLALDGGADGLTCLRAIIGSAPQALAPGGLLLVEHHQGQSGAVLELMRAAGLLHPRAHRDLEGVSRFASAVAPVATAPAGSGRAPTGPEQPQRIDGRAPLPGSDLSQLASPD